MNSGIVLIDKQVGWTSRDVDNKLSGIFGTKKIGHAGTLDPFASGLLIIAINKATKIIPFLEKGDKTYEVEMKLGEKRNTGDNTGEVIFKKAVPQNIDEQKIKELFLSMVGEIEQIPPMYSAVKYNGKALYKYAREGKTIEVKPRKVYIKKITLIKYSNYSIFYEVEVSKGTYIRTLSEYIAEKLDTVGYTENLRRTKIMNFSVKKAKKIQDISESDIIEISSCLDNMPTVYVEGKNEFLALHGQHLKILDNNDIVLVRNQNEVIAIYERQQDNIFHCKRGLM